MGLPRVCLALAFALLSSAPFAESAGEKKPAADLAEMKVRLRLNLVENSKLMEHYGLLLDRELALRDNVRACVKSGDERLPQYQQALNEARSDLEQTKKRLIVLESEKAKLVERLGAKNAGDGSLEQFEKVNRVLERILDRLNSLDKRLDKLERQQ